MDTKAFFAGDFAGALFPLKTNAILIEHHSQKLEQYIANVLSEDPANAADKFLSQARAHAAKPRNHLRRTAVLDPVASYFIYDLMLRNRAAFGLPVNDKRRVFGYRFDDNKPVPVSKAYKDFGQAVEACRKQHKHVLKFDIASYFNSIYHHDATAWFAALPGVSGPDASAFGRFFREINAGRSIDFLPQGIYPTKMIGSEYLRFIDASGEIKCAQTLRFMDDFYLFDNDPAVLSQDFYRIQELLGWKALAVNPTKTALDAEEMSVKAKASAIKQQVMDLLHIAEQSTVNSASGIEAGDQFTVVLAQGEVDQLLQMLVDPTADEGDVEFILGILQDHHVDLSTLLPSLAMKFPNIMKQLHRLIGLAPDKSQLADQLLALLKEDPFLIEYQLFWLAVIAEDHLAGAQGFGDIVHFLYAKAGKHRIVQAKILEIPNQNFGLKEIRDEVLKSGGSDWLAWSAAVGTRTLAKAERNYALKYFSNGSALNKLIADCVQSLP